MMTAMVVDTGWWILSGCGPESPSYATRRMDMHSLLRFLGFVEHEVHDDDHGSPEHDLLMPEQNFAEMEKGQCHTDRADRDTPTKHRVFDNGVRPDGQAAKIQKHCHYTAEFKSSAE